MKFLKSLLKYLSFFLLGSLTSTLLSSLAGSYFIVDQVSKSLDSQATQPFNANLRELILIGTQYAEELEKFDRLNAETKSLPAPGICTILCNPTDMDQERLATERTRYLEEYFKRVGPRQAMKDPLFRLRLMDIGFLSKLYSTPLRVVLGDILKAKADLHQKSTKLALALKLQGTLFKEISRILLHWDEYKNESRYLDHIRTVHQSCGKAVPSQKLISECNSASH